MSNLLDRNEFKFQISSEQRRILIQSLPEHVRPDIHAGADAGYRIFSLYYDNIHRDCYWEKQHGLKSRRKLRVRVYETAASAGDGAAFVEIKHKLDSRGVKRRISGPLDEVLRIARGEPVSRRFTRSQEQTCEEIRRLVVERGFEPVCCLRYDRKAYADAESDLRITFDENVRHRAEGFDRPDQGDFPHVLLEPGRAIMEVKVSGPVPLWLVRQLAETRCVVQSRSKYCDALRGADPVLAALRRPATPAPALAAA